MYVQATHLFHVLAAAAASCTPDSGMGCFPCCGVTDSTTAVQQSGNASLGAAAIIVFVVVVWRILVGKSGGGGKR